jgi:hypothetical protein
MHGMATLKDDYSWTAASLFMFLAMFQHRCTLAELLCKFIAADPGIVDARDLEDNWTFPSDNLSHRPGLADARPAPGLVMGTEDH